MNNTNKDEKNKKIKTDSDNSLNLEQIFSNLSKRSRLSLKRFLWTKQFPYFILYILTMIMVFLVLGMVVSSLENLEDESQVINYLIPIILAVQLIILFFQTYNQVSYNRIAKISFLPRLRIYKRVKSSQVHDSQLEIGIVNSGSDAPNMRYWIEIDDKFKKSNTPYFTLAKDEKVVIYLMSKPDFIKSKIDIRVNFEDIVRSTQYKAYFMKYAGEDSFTTVSTGLY